MESIDLGRIIDIRKGRKPNSVSHVPRPGFVQHLQIADLRRERQPEFVASDGATLANPDDILICWDGSKAGTSATGLSGAAGSTIAVLKITNRRFASRYLAWFIRANFGRLNGSSIGAAVPHIDRRVLAELRVPICTISEQHRIADILDKADAIRRKRKEAIALTEELLGSAFLEMFGDPVTNPKGWPVSTFGEHVSLLEYGPRFYNEKYTKTGVRIVRITDLASSGVLDFESMPQLIIDDCDQQRYLLRPGDVIFARTGATVGKTALSVKGDPPAIPGAYFIRLRFNETVSPRYAREVLASQHVQEMIVSRSRQSAQQNFSGPRIRELPLPLPPRRLQDKFHDIAVGQIRHLNVLRGALSEADNLFNSLVARAFSGSLKTNR